MSVTIIHQ